jgi:hypothetical protein
MSSGMLEDLRGFYIILQPQKREKELYVPLGDKPYLQLTGNIEYRLLHLDLIELHRAGADPLAWRYRVVEQCYHSA